MSAALAPLLSGADLDAPLAWRDGRPLSRRAYLAEVQALAAALPAGGPLLAMTGDRWRFALALGAALLRGQASLLPPNHTPDTVARLQGLFPDAYALVEPGSPPVAMRSLAFPSPEVPAGEAPLPGFASDTVVARVLTSGSTGTPGVHAKHWGGLVENIGAEAERIAEHMGRSSLEGVTIVGTVPPHHMYGFESTVLIAMLGGAAFAAERPFFPADIVQVLERLPRPRVLVTTPFHLKTLLESGLALPAVDLCVSATAPLSPQMAMRAEAALGAPLMEIYGCTEAGQVATRRTTDGPEWRTYRGLQLSGDGEQASVQGGHVPEPTALADVLEVISPTRFRLLGRSNDLINVAGKRSSLSHLNYHLNSIAGVHDGAFWLPEAGEVEDVARLVAFVVAPGLSRQALLAELRQRVDAVLLPRRIVMVDALPRDGTGKLPATRLAALATELLGRDAAPRRA
ncbi:AMP-binding protein [Aquabacterium sp. A7-Y]|uniref:AMP-binding protein n=1 Tax=Aquabacterium sp. A7-Y TaxID=1349605 RepID=UPI00223E0714|nr:AMP-binding protein [Aquabacterium sp. A7-Y]MCW7536450.1 AMP-binding protein [Aquabacterium sp. A7-Y]